MQGGIPSAPPNYGGMPRFPPNVQGGPPPMGGPPAPPMAPPMRFPAPTMPGQAPGSMGPSPADLKEMMNEKVCRCIAGSSRVRLCLRRLSFQLFQMHSHRLCESTWEDSRAVRVRILTLAVFWLSMTCCVSDRWHDVSM